MARSGSAADMGAVPCAEPESSPLARLGCAGSKGLSAALDILPSSWLNIPGGHQPTPGWGQHCPHLPSAAASASGCPCLLRACGEGWVLWLMPGGCLPRQVLPPPRVHEAVVLWGRCHVRALHPRTLPAAAFLPPQHCQLCSAGRFGGKG